MQNIGFFQKALLSFGLCLLMPIFGHWPSFKIYSLIDGYTFRVATDKTTRNQDFWPKAVAGKATEEEWKQFVREERLSACVDFPSSLFWKDLLKIYPNAKVVVTFFRKLRKLLKAGVAQ